MNHNTESYTIGIDMGGTNTAFAAVDRKGHILAQDSIPTASATAEEWADRLAGRVIKLIEDCGIKDCVTGIGIGAPCANTQSGCIEAATDLPWPSPIALTYLIESRLGIPTIIGNDANAAAIGEMTYGTASGVSNFIVLTLGTGVGGGVVCDGHLLNGTRGFAGELGHVTFPFAAERTCGCGRKGCLQTVASAKGIVQTALTLLERDDSPSILRNIDAGELTAKAIAEAADKGDSIARETYDFTGRCLGKAAAEFAAFTDPEAIILFGGVAKAGDLLIRPMQEAFRESALHLYRDRVRISVSGIKDSEAALLGAAALPSISGNNARLKAL